MSNGESGGAGSFLPLVGPIVSIFADRKAEKRAEKHRQNAAAALAAAALAASNARIADALANPNLGEIARSGPGPGVGAGVGRVPGFPTLPTVPFPQVSEIAPGQRVDPLGRVVGGTPTPPGVPPWVQAIVQILQIIFDRLQRSRDQGLDIFIPAWLLDLLRQQQQILLGNADIGGQTMANVPANIPGDFFGSGPGLDFGDVVGPNSWACRTLGIGCLSASPAPPMLPTLPGFGFPTLPSVPTVPGVVGQNGGAAMMMPGCPTSPFRAGSTASARAVPFVLVNPVSGRPVWFGPLGRPMLWSGDLAACKRVARVASRASRRLGRRRRGGRR